MGGCLIVFEGPEGAGKSTQISLLHEGLAASGVSVTATREPGGTPVGDAIRHLLLHADLSIEPLVEFLLYSASRAQHVSEVIAPALRRGDVVLSDRFASASVAYQGYGRGLDVAFVEELNRRATAGLRPDLTVLLDLDPVEGLRRVAGRGAADRLEREELAFHQRVRQGFLRQAEGDPSWLVLDAREDPQRLARSVWRAARERCGIAAGNEAEPRGRAGA